MKLPGAKVGVRVGFQAKQVISRHRDLLPQLAFLLCDFLELGRFLHLSVSKELTGDCRRWKSQSLL